MALKPQIGSITFFSRMQMKISSYFEGISSSRYYYSPIWADHFTRVTHLNTTIKLKPKFSPICPVVPVDRKDLNAFILLRRHEMDPKDFKKFLKTDFFLRKKDLHNHIYQ